MEIIKVENLKFRYPADTGAAISNLSLTVNQGEFITVCGKSGCGKSTLLRLLKPALAPHGEQSGKVLFEGRNIEELSQREQTEKIGFVLQNPDNQIVTDKVWHELAFGLESLSCLNSEIRSKVAETASFFGIEGWFHKKTTELSGGQKQLLNLAAVTVMQPSLIILDEPTSQLDPIAASEFLGMLSKINRELGTTVIISEHRLEEVFPLSDRVLVLEDGGVVAFDKPANIGKILDKTDNDMKKALPTPMRVYMAADGGDNCPITVREGKKWLDSAGVNTGIKFDSECRINDNPIITVKDVWFRYEKNLPDVIKGLSMKVNKGEIYAVVGGNGTGKSTALSLIGGFNKPYRGNVCAQGRISVLPQNPQVLFTRKTVIQDLQEISADEELLKRIVSLCGLEKITGRHPFDLSGGEMQKAALAKVLLTSPEILLLDEPTKGFDAQFKEHFASILQKLKQNGITVVMVSHDIEFCAQYADRCGMFFDGNIVSEGIPREFFGGKSFYTTAANRMARGILPDAVLAEDIIAALGIETTMKLAEKIKEIPPEIKGELPEKVTQQRTKKNFVWGGIFLLLFAAFELVFAGKYTDFRQYFVHSGGFLLLGLALYNLIPQKDIISVQMAERKRKIPRRTIVSMLAVLLTVPLTIYIGMTYLGDRKYYFISLLIILQTMLPFIISFENRKPKTSELLIISVLSAIAVAGRCAFYMVPHFTPVLAVVIIAGVCFGGETGFLVGATSAFVSNFFFSQGPWTPWQMFVTGIIGFLAGILFRKGFLRKTRGSLCIFGGITAIVIYGGIMNPASMIMYYHSLTWEMLLLSYAQGISFDIIHAVSTAFFLWFISGTMIEKLDRIKVKYGLID